MQKSVLWLEHALNVDQSTIYKLLSTLLILFIGWIIYRLIHAAIINRIIDVDLRYQWHKATDYLFLVLGIFLIGRIWYEGMTAVATFLGLVSAGIAIALKDPIVNFAGWLFIVWRKPFTVGDRIQVGEHAGDVVDQRIFVFTMMEIRNWVDADQSTGRVLYVPNGWVFTQTVANFTHGPKLVWNEIPISTTFESKWKRVKELIQSLANKYHEEHNGNAGKEFELATKLYPLKYDKLTPTVYTSVRENGVQLTVRYLCHPRVRRGSIQYFWDGILSAFSENPNIQFAYPTQRFVTNPLTHPEQDQL
ncbi:MAG TPA: mechanosensitive ion channel domain-containing protein [Anaerolineales bacterium]|nr:mechanosensitive ion channel domain-containing protein [Anaerolineales bacterium]